LVIDGGGAQLRSAASTGVALSAGTLTSTGAASWAALPLATLPHAASDAARLPAQHRRIDDGTEDLIEIDDTRGN
jgi:hypothetical protein